MSIASAKFVAFAMLAVGILMLGNNWSVVPAAAEGTGSTAIVLQSTSATTPDLTFVALLDDDREDGEKREEAEREGDRREGADAREREQPRREGAERKEAEGPRREGDRPREGEARREGDRPREAEPRREGEPRREEFRPKTDSEEVLYRMIVQLQREVAELRNALRSREGDVRREGGEREREQPRREREQPRREGDQPREREGDRPAAPREGTRESQTSREARWLETKEGQYFKRFDKNGDQAVSLEECFAMLEGELTDERRTLETRRFKESDPNGDSKLTADEFVRWLAKSRSQNNQEGEQPDTEKR